MKNKKLLFLLPLILFACNEEKETLIQLKGKIIISNLYPEPVQGEVTINLASSNASWIGINYLGDTVLKAN